MYNFRKNIKVYIEYGGFLYRLNVYGDFNTSQTFEEKDYDKKTLHEQTSLHKGATITQANKANFSFTIPITSIGTSDLLSSLLDPDYSSGNVASCNMFIQLDNVVLKLIGAVVENVVYNIERASILTATISGSAAKLDENATLSALPVVNMSTDYKIVRGIEVYIAETQVTSIVALNLEVNHSINWPAYNNLHSSLEGQIAYPNLYRLSDRRISGSVTQFLTSETTNQSAAYGVDVPLSIDIYVSNTEGPFLTMEFDQAVFTRRLSIDDLITRVYDFRNTGNDIIYNLET